MRRMFRLSRAVILLVAVVPAACKDDHPAVPDAPAPPPVDAPVDTQPPPPDAPPPPVDAPVATDAGTPDAPPGALPDIQLVEDRIRGTVQIEDDYTPEPCEIVEGCVAPGPGARRVLRFDTVTGNFGNGDLYVGHPPPAGQAGGIFEWSQCHMHHHVTGYADYRLIKPDTGVVVSGHKRAFCLMDTTQMDQSRPGNHYDCGNQGISAGWADTYNAGLPCQFIDITGLDPGRYTLEIIVNSSQQLPESNYNNNTFRMSVLL